jgi:hypothetical protein
MRSPKDMRIIQIEVTNACVHQCSNCTRFCGHHKKNFFMDWDTFQKAVKSLEGFDHCIGIMGGEPTLHPQFERFARYLAEQHPLDYPIHTTRKPILNFPRYIRDKNYFGDECLNQCKGVGLWTSITKQYYKNFELIQHIFSYQSINDHDNPSLHQPLLASRKEMGISDEEWIPLRDNCLIQNMWSASITPKGAFFCEVAAALDMLFDGPGGWPIEPDWWKREPKDFGYQLKWCEICGGALFHSGRLSSEEIDDVSPILYERLKEVGSPKLKAGRVSVMDMSNPQPGQLMPDTKNRYLTDFNERISRDNSILFPGEIQGIVFCQTGDGITEKLKKLEKSFNHIILFATEQEIVDKLKTSVTGHEEVTVVSPQLHSFGRTLNKAIEAAEDNWICLMEEHSDIPEGILERLKSVVINPGVLYSFPGLEEIKLFHPEAMALKSACYDGVSQCDCLNMFNNLWSAGKQVELEENFDILQNPDLEDWQLLADDADSEHRSQVHRALDKIKKDYEG